MIGTLGFGRHEHGRQVRFVHVIAARQWRGRFNRVDAHDGLAQPLLVRPDLLGEVGEGRFVPERDAQLLARRFELAAHPAHAARPGVFTQRIDHGATDAPLGKSLELDAAAGVEALRGIDETDHAVLHQITEVDRMRHRGGHAPGEGFDKRKAGLNSIFLLD